MFSVGLLYSTHDFLKLIPTTGLTPDEFKNYFKNFKYSASDKILDVSFKCGWSKLTQSGQIELSARGKEIITFGYQQALLLQLEDLILNFNPVWASILLRGRTEAKNFLPPDALQCFKECGLFGKLTDDIVKFWDKLTLAYRNYTQKKLTEIGRTGEKLSFEYEKTRTGFEPIWQAVESNIAGYDLLSILSTDNSAKLQIEVKTTTSSLNYATLHITRNEWQTAISSLNYLFHLWHIGDSENKLYMASVTQMEKHIPTDKSDGKWETVEIPFRVFI
jgi:hypothetical protein